MRVKSKVLKALISSVLAITMISSVAIQAFAGTSTSEGSSDGASLGGNGTLEPSVGALKILPSSLDTDASIDDLKNFHTRYGKVFKYPLLMQTGYTDYKPTDSNSGWFKYSDDIDTNVSHADSEIKVMQTYKGSRGVTREFVSYASNGNWYINNYCGSSNNSIYLEDYIHTIMHGSSANGYTTEAKNAFWYFYSTLKQGVLNDTSADGSTSTLGSSLGDTMKVLQQDETKMSRFVKGYKVAIKAVYGGVIDNKVNVLDTINAYISDTTSKGMKSFVIERLQSMGVSGKSTFFSVQSYIHAGWGNGKKVMVGYYGSEVCKDMTQFEQDMREGFYRNGVANVPGIGYDYAPTFVSDKVKINTVTHHLEDGGIFGRIYPVAVKTENGKWVMDYDKYSTEDPEKDTIQAFGGWAFYPIGKMATNVKDLIVGYPDKVSLGTEVTYNAYLSSDNSLGEDDKFGENGRVMTDTVYLSKPKQIDAENLKNNLDTIFSSVAVDNSISLSTPTVGTDYSLYRIQYRITGANGSTVLNIGDNFENSATMTIDDSKTIVTKKFFTGATKKINIYGKQIKSALDNSSAITYKERKKVSLAGSDIYSSDYDLYIYNGNTYVPLTNRYGTVYTTEWITKHRDTALGSYSSSDITNNSTDLRYIYVNGSYKPVYFDGDNWYYTPIAKTTNLLIQVRADYKASYSKDDKLFQSADVPEYLLAKNTPTKDFQSTDIYAFLDNYATNVWGTVYNRSFASKSEVTGKTISPLNDNGSYLFHGEGDEYALNSHRAIFYNNQSISKALGEFAGKNDSSMKNKIYSTNVISSERRKVDYVDLIMKSAPKVESNKGYSYVNSRLTVNLSKFNEKNEKSSAGTDTEPSFGYTGDNNGGKVSVISKVKNNQYPAEMLVKAFNYDDLIVDISNRIYSRTSDGQTVTERTKNIQKGYRESVFAKLVLQYNAYTYTMRADKSSVSTPNAANWVGSPNNTTAERLGLTTSTTPKIIKADPDVYTGFYRFGSGYCKDGTVFVRNNNDDVNSSIAYVRTSPFGVSSTMSGNWFAEPFTQSSVDIPLTFNFAAYTPSGISVYTPTTTSEGTSSSITESEFQSSLYIYPEVTMWAENEKTNTGESVNTTYASVVTVGQKRRTVPVVVYNKLDLSTPSPSATVTGTAIAFDTRAKALAERLGATNAPVLYSGSGINVAIGSTKVGTISTYMLDFRNDKKFLKSEWGNSDIAVLSSVKKFVDKLSVNVDASISVEEGSSVKKKLDFGKKEGVISVSGEPAEAYYIDITVNGGIVTRATYTKGGYFIVYNVSNADTDSASLTYVSGTETAGSSKEKAIRAEVMNALRGTKVVGANNVLVKSFQNGNNHNVNGNLKNWLNSNGDNRFTTDKGWYMEDTSVLTVKCYVTDYSVNGGIYTDQIPLNWGPSTPADKNSYFSNGWTGTVNCKYTFDYSNKGYNIVLKTNNSKKDFIVADVTINDATTY